MQISSQAIDHSLDSSLLRMTTLLAEILSDRLIECPAAIIAAGRLSAVTI
jgi:hypothetical protein